MQRYLWVCFFAALIACPALAAPDVAAGKFKSEDQRCQECHGSDGNGERPEGKYPKLAGQFSVYLVKQMRDYRSGARKHDFMSMLARNIDDVDNVDIAAYYAGQKKMQGREDVDDALGKKLFMEGDAGRNIVSCASCHAHDAASASEGQYPFIEGQERQYLERQIVAWRSGERSNSAGGIMNNIAAKLTDTEIQALARYISGLR